jgi:hypothetical protein
MKIFAVVPAQPLRRVEVGEPLLLHSLNHKIARSLNEKMEPYAKPNERKVGAKRPKISHLPSAIETRTRQQRQAEKQAVAAERRAIKKSARRHLKRDLLAELEETD